MRWQQTGNRKISNAEQHGEIEENQPQINTKAKPICLELNLRNRVGVVDC
jgi:hypothetical protein